MQLQQLLYAALVIFAILLCQSSTSTDARRLVFYNPKPKVITSQLLITHKRAKPCPQGRMRDHRDRCRRAIIFGRNK